MNTPSDGDKSADKSQPSANTTNVPWTGAPAQRPDASEAQLGRAQEAGVNTDARGGPGSAAGSRRAESSASTEAGDSQSVSTEPRSDTRIGKHSSQGLAGAQGSGGAAEREPISRRG
jgi:hypothetical protein